MRSLVSAFDIRVQFHRLDGIFRLLVYCVEGSHVFDMVFASQIHRALVTKRKTLEQEYKDPTTEDDIFSPRQSAKQLIATSQNDQLLLFEMLRRNSFSSRLQIVENLATAINGLAVEQLFYQPEYES